ncbi:MAG: quinone oxidoreductase [bacterium]|nr:quinone oxidoreductase [bacterium]
MVNAIRIHRLGGPEVLQWEAIDVGEPDPDEVRIRHTAVGLNFIDTYHRTGLYPVAALPSGLGMEAAGVVDAIGNAVVEFEVGDRVAYGAAPPGAYAEMRVMPASKLLKLSDGISDEQAAAMMLKGMTAEYLLLRTYPVQTGETILVHAAAGGVGLILCQWAKALGATVIGTVGSDEKAELATAHGCHHPIIYTRENFVERVRDLTQGKGVPVVYDSVGKETWAGSLDCLQSRGMMVSFGNASGAVEPFQPVELSAKGSLFLTRPTLMSYTETREELVGSAKALFDVVESGAVKVDVRQRWALKDAAEAHRALEARETTGSTVLVP